MALLLVGLAASPVWAGSVTIDWVTVGNVGNAADTTGFGTVNSEYRISKTETTNAQYAGTVADCLCQRTLSGHLHAFSGMPAARRHLPRHPSGHITVLLDQQHRVGVREG